LQSRKKSGKSRLDEEKAAISLQLRTKHNLVVVAMTASAARHLNERRGAASGRSTKLDEQRDNSEAKVNRESNSFADGDHNELVARRQHEGSYEPPPDPALTTESYSLRTSPEMETDIRHSCHYALLPVEEIKRVVLP
jgi:hypothetical protein